MNRLQNLKPKIRYSSTVRFEYSLLEPIPKTSFSTIQPYCQCLLLSVLLHVGVQFEGRYKRERVVCVFGATVEMSKQILELI